MFSLLDSPYTCLTTTRTLLIELRYAVYICQSNTRKTFPTLAFAARLVVDSRVDFIRSLDDACLERIREATRYTLDTSGRKCCSFTDYEADRYVVWNGLDDAKLPLSTMSDGELETQLEMMGRRGCGDRIRVHMAVEVDTGVDGGVGGCEEKGSVDGSVGSAESLNSVDTVKTLDTIGTVVQAE